ncbi:hypothetical protein G7046_g9582 [Stylonectria norvegica]|nr:hypothetical protein G7046_g9582 [Stylonectria norvegica]
MRSTIALLALAASLVSAQANYTSELDMTIDPNTVTQQNRAAWCQAQTNTCDLLCGDDTDGNSCSQTTLAYNCTCASNESAPGLQYYTQTLPTFICNELFSQCISSNVGNQDGQDACKKDISDLCGTLDPPKAAITADDSSSTTEGTSTGTASATATSSGSGSSATDAAVTSTSSDGFAAATMVPAGKGAAAIAIGLMAYLV